MSLKVEQTNKVLGIRELLSDVKSELIALETEHENKSFALDQLELEVRFVVSESRDGNAGIDLQVVRLGGNKHTTAEHVHTLRLSYKALSPEPARSGSRLIPGQRFHPKSHRTKSKHVEHK